MTRRKTITEQVGPRTRSVETARREICEYLHYHGEITIQDVIRVFGFPSGTASRHLSQLYANGILDVRVEPKPTGVKAGQPRKWYRLSHAAWSDDNLLSKLRYLKPVGGAK